MLDREKGFEAHGGDLSAGFQGRLEPRVEDERLLAVTGVRTERTATSPCSMSNVDCPFGVVLAIASEFVSGDRSESLDDVGILELYAEFGSDPFVGDAGTSKIKTL